MHPSQQPLLALTRRHFLHECGVGVGKIAFASLLTGAFARRGSAAVVANTNPLAAKAPHFAGKAKRVIHLFMTGAPSQLELFDNKPTLTRHEGQPLPASVIRGQRLAFIRPDAAALGPRLRFARHGRCGAELSETLPHLARVVDDICIVRSMHTDQFNHAPAQIFLSSGSAQPGRPCLGSWALYGLGAETENLPAFVAMTTAGNAMGGSTLWSSGFLPTTYAGVRCRSEGDPILNLSSPAGVDARLQRDTLDLVTSLDQRRLDLAGDAEIRTRIASYEMAFRLQTSAVELTDLRRETRETLNLYGCDPDKPSFARACLLARRMVERGVRFVSIINDGWDAHTDVAGNVRNNCKMTDQASAALITDLKRRGLLDETLVIWGGEFGRTPMVESNPAEKRSLGRDHHPRAYSMWLAGGGIRPGVTYGTTDDFCFNAAENPVHIHDLQATILHCLGFDHERLTYHYAGRDFRLTDVHGKVVRGLLA